VRRFREYLSQSSRAFRDVFDNPGLRRLQLAWAGSLLGTWAYGVAVVVYAFEQGGATAVGVVGLARWLAAAAASPFAAMLGDRFERRVVMVCSDLARAALIGCAAVAVYSDAPAIVVYLLSGLVSISATAFRPAQAALVPSLARTPEELTAANVSASAIESIGIFLGPALGGLLLAASGPSLVFVVTSALLVWSALLLTGVKPVAAAEPKQVREAGSVVDELLAGFKTVARERRLRLLVGLFSAQTFVDGMLNVLIVVIALDLLDVGNAGVGFLNSAVGIGGLLGALAAAALVAIWPNQAFALVLLAIVGIGNTLVDVSGMTLLQRSAPEEVLARVFGVLESLLLLTTGLGAVFAPLLLNWIGTRGALIVAGALLPLLVVPAWPRLTAIDRAATVSGDRLDALRANPIFAPLPEATLEQLGAALDEVSIPAGAEVMHQGDRGDRFYLIRSGTFDVEVDGKQAQHLGPGDSFGEIALLRDIPRTATVRAQGNADVYALERQEFLKAVTGFGPSLSAAEGVIGMRMGPARAGIVRA
jgi:MFS family permease